MVWMDFMDKLRVLHLCNKVPFPGRDGSSIAMEALIRLERKLGHTVTVLALNSDKHFIQTPIAPQDVSLETFHVNLSPSIFNIWKYLFQSCSYFASRFHIEKLRNRITELAPDVDVIVVDSVFMAVYRSAFGNTPFVLRSHNVEHRIWERTLSNSPWGVKKWIIQWQVNKLKKWETACIRESNIWAISSEDAEHMETIGALRTEILPCTFDPDDTWPYSGADPSSVYHLGALDWLPNIQGLSWFVEHVLPLVNVPITVISKNWPPQIPLNSGISHVSDLDNHFDFMEHGVFIAPILSGSGMRIKILEAMARGKAIITTTIGSEGLRNPTGIHIADTPEEFARAIQLLIQDSELRNASGREARAHAMTNFADDMYLQLVNSSLKLTVRSS